MKQEMTTRDWDAMIAKFDEQKKRRGRVKAIWIMTHSKGVDFMYEYHNGETSNGGAVLKMTASYDPVV